MNEEKIIKVLELKKKKSELAAEIKFIDAEIKKLSETLAVDLRESEPITVDFSGVKYISEVKVQKGRVTWDGDKLKEHFYKQEVDFNTFMKKGEDKEVLGLKKVK